LQSMKLRGYVVRIDTGEEKGRSSVGVVFTDWFRVSSSVDHLHGALAAAGALLSSWHGRGGPV